ncbi:hypothetical protein [Actinoplanes sp. NPDC049599]|uniref:hypothetical protein n=1 Tax=Actinoplanes sp. NPDC049599 TaxID=3363903 RepID=UPI0037952D21
MTGPTGLFRHGGPAGRTVQETMTALGLDRGSVVLRAIYQAERPALDVLFKTRHEWPEKLAAVRAFPPGAVERTTADYLNWRADILYWKAMIHFFPDQLADRVVISGADAVRELAAETSRFLLAPFHIRQFPLISPAVTALGLRTASIIDVNTPADVPADPAPEQRKLALDGKDPLVLVRASRALKDRRTISVFPDLHRGGRPAPERVTFLGQELLTGSSWHLFCLHERLPVVPCYAAAGPEGTPVVTFGEPLGPPRTADEAVELVQRLYTFYETPLRPALVEWEGWTEANWVRDDVVSGRPGR